MVKSKKNTGEQVVNQPAGATYMDMSNVEEKVLPQVAAKREEIPDEAQAEEQLAPESAQRGRPDIFVDEQGLPERTPLLDQDSAEFDSLDIKNYEYYLAKDFKGTGEWIRKLQKAGWQFCYDSDVTELPGKEHSAHSSTQQGSRIERIDSDGQKMYLMKLPKQYYTEDIARMMADIDETDREISDYKYDDAKSLYHAKT